MKAPSFIITLLLFACVAKKEIPYELPAAMLPHVKTEYAARCDKGLALYKITCAGCHNTKSGRKDIIPDFAPDQLRGYALRVSNSRHEQNMPDTLVSEEELAIIMTFLNYKKKNSLQK